MTNLGQRHIDHWSTYDQILISNHDFFFTKKLLGSPIQSRSLATISRH